MKSDNFVGLI